MADLEEPITNSLGWQRKLHVASCSRKSAGTKFMLMSATANMGNSVAKHFSATTDGFDPLSTEVSKFLKAVRGFVLTGNVC